MRFGRYHVFYMIDKPEAVSLRTLLCFHQKYYELKPPTFGLNFINDKKLEIKISCYNG